MAKLRRGDRVEILKDYPWGSNLYAGDTFAVAYIEDECAIGPHGWAIPSNTDEFDGMAVKVKKPAARRKP